LFPQALLARRSSQQSCPQLSSWDCPRSGLSVSQEPGFAFGLAEPPQVAVGLSSSPCRFLWRVDLPSGRLTASSFVTVFL